MIIYLVNIFFFSGPFLAMVGIRTAFRDGFFVDSLLLFFAIVALEAHFNLTTRFFIGLASSGFSLYLLSAKTRPHLSFEGAKDIS